MTDYLDKDEVRRFLEKANERGPRDELICRVLVFTGMRLGEATVLVVGDFDLTRGQITLSRTVTTPHVLQLWTRGRPNFKPKKRIVLLEENKTGLTGGKEELLPTEIVTKYHHVKGEVIKKGLKASHPTRTVPLSDRQTLNAVASWTKGMDRNAFLWRSQKGGRLCEEAVHRIVKTVMLDAGIAESKAHPHNLRHTFAVHTLKAGVPLNILQRILGHSDIATTTIYLRLVADDLSEAMEKAGSIY